MNQEDEFFLKWLKQKENLGDRKKNQSDLMSENSDSKAFNATSTKKRDASMIELDKLNEQIKKNEKMKNYKVEDKKVRKALDVKIISAETIEALVRYLNITENDTDYELDKKLTASMAVGRKSTLVEQRVDNPIKEEKEEDEDLDRDDFNNQ